MIVGQRDFRAFRWSQGAGFQELGPTAYFANDVNADGSVIVGQTTTGNAFRWTAAGGVQDLGRLPGDTGSMATGVSADGSMIVGISTSNFGFVGRGGTANQTKFDVKPSRAFVWTQAGGMQDLTQLLIAGGVNLNGNRLAAATCITADGEWIGVAAPDPNNSFETIGGFASLTVSLSGADFDGDGTVDGDDLERWRNNFGTGTTLAQGDADGDGDVDGGDFLIWQRKLGVSASSAAATAVPEPEAVVMVIAAGAACVVSSRRRRRS